MSTIKVVSMTGAEVGTVELNDAIFGVEPNMSVVHEVVKNHLANCRQGTQSALTRAEVSGGGRKPEGHRPRPSGQHPRPAVDARRHRVCPQAPHLQLRAQQEGQASGSQVRPVLQG